MVMNIFLIFKKYLKLIGITPETYSKYISNIYNFRHVITLEIIFLEKKIIY
jgi:hypothetical protein